MTRRAEHPGDETRIVEVYSAANEIEAGAVRAALDAAGIQARLVGDRLGNAWGEVPLGFRSEPKLWVREEDAAAARRVIAEFRANPGVEGLDETAESYPREGEEGGGGE